MSLSQTGTFVETLIDLVDGATRAHLIGFSSNNKLVLNGKEGANGGSGIPWGGLVGCLIQRRVCFDTTETATPCILPSSSLLDNLNRIRWHHKPATWFEMTPTDPRSMRVHVASGLWYKDEADYVDFIGGNSPIITSPVTDPRIDVVYLTASGIVAISEGAESASPTYTIPSGIILPIGAVYVTPVACGIGWFCDTTLYSGYLYSGYIYKDLRPFVTYPGGGGGVGTHNALPDLQGGQADQYYHTTQVQHTAVGLMVTAGLDALTAAEVDQLENINATTISIAQWGYLGAMDQGVAVADSPAFASLTINIGDILPAVAVGLNLGDAGHRWGVFGTYVNLPTTGWVGINLDMRIIFREANYIEFATDTANRYYMDSDPSAATPMTVTAANINIIGGSNVTGDDAGLWLRNEETNIDWSIFVDESDSDHLKIARENTEVAEFDTVGNFRMFSGNDIDPEDATGQDLGNSAHRWDLYANDINMDNGGVIHCTTLGGPIITFDSISDYLEITECRVSIGHDTPIVALDINTPTFNHNGILLGSGGPPANLGMIKFTGSDFFGFTPSGWLSLTASGIGGGGVSLWTDYGAYIEPSSPNDVRIGTGQKLYPEDATGQDLGRGGNRWDIYARRVNMPDTGWIGILGNELLTVNAAGNFTFSGVTSIVVPDGCWIGADAACSWVFDSTAGDVTTADKVGIKNTAPGAILDSGAVASFQVGDGSASFYASIKAGTNNEAMLAVENDARSYRFGILGNDTWVLYDDTANALRIVVDTAGNMEVIGRLRLTNTVSFDTRVHAMFGGPFFQNAAANTPTSLRVLPNGAPGGWRSAFEIYNTDYLGDNANWERVRMVFSNTANVFEIISEKGGTGTVRPMALMGANVGIAETNPQRLLHVDGRVRIDDPGTEPGVTAGGGFTHYYGSLYYFCGRPDQWLRIDIEGSTYHIPCYS